MKFLSAIYDAMSRDCDECFEPDPVSKRDKWLLDRDNGNVLAVAMRALSEGCGADIAKCEGNDPLLDCDLDGGTPTPTANHDYSDYNQMSLAMIPSQVPEDRQQRRRRRPTRDRLKKNYRKSCMGSSPFPPCLIKQLIYIFLYNFIIYHRGSVSNGEVSKCLGIGDGLLST